MLGSVAVGRIGVLSVVVGILVSGLTKLQGAPSASPKIVEVRADALIAAVCPDCMPSGRPLEFRPPGIAHSYQRQRDGVEVDLLIGIYPNDDAASRALVRTTPQMMKVPPNPIADESFFSNRGCHFRKGNAIVLLLASVDLAYDEAVRLTELLEQSFNDGAIARRGLEVDTPAIMVDRVDEGFSPPKVTFRIEHKKRDRIEILRPAGPQEWSRTLSDERFEDRMVQGFFDTEPTIRIARPTGEIAELVLSDIPPAVFERSDAREDGVALSEAVRRDLIGKVRNPASNLQEQFQAVQTLANHATADSIPIFDEVLASDKDAVVKKAALVGLASALGSKGIDRYRTILADARQPELIRRNAIRLVELHGNASDLVTLEQIRAEGNTVLSEAANRAIGQLKKAGETGK